MLLSKDRFWSLWKVCRLEPKKTKPRFSHNLGSLQCFISLYSKQKQRKTSKPAENPTSALLNKEEERKVVLLQFPFEAH